MIKIYILTNPIDGRVFYVGVTNNPKARLKRHIYDTLITNTKKTDFIQTICDKGFTPYFFEIDTCHPLEASKVELFYIDYFTQLGYELMQKRVTNYTKTYLTRTTSFLERGRWTTCEVELTENNKWITPIKQNF